MTAAYPYDLDDPAELEAAVSYPDVIPPCPAWCVLPTGHRYEGVVRGEPTTHERTHSSRDWQACGYVRNGAGVVAYETNAGGVVTLHRPAVEVTVGGSAGHEVTARRQDADLSWEAAEATALALDLCDAASLLRSLTAVEL